MSFQIRYFALIYDTWWLFIMVMVDGWRSRGQRLWWHDVAAEREHQWRSDVSLDFISDMTIDWILWQGLIHSAMCQSDVWCKWWLLLHCVWSLSYRVSSGSVWSICQHTRKTTHVNLLISLQTPSSPSFHLSSTSVRHFGHFCFQKFLNGMVWYTRV